jgi:phosphonate transport system permease protein
MASNSSTVGQSNMGQPNTPYRKVGLTAILGSWRMMLASVLAVAALAYGWRITEINFPSLVLNLPKAERIFVGLLQPDIIAPVTDTTAAETPFAIGAANPTPSTVPIGGGRLTVTPGGIQPGGEVTVALNGVRPGASVLLSLVDSSGNARPIRRDEKTDPTGNFSLTFNMPPAVASGAYTVKADITWSLGRWQMTEVFQLSLEKMVETIFLALMGTFFAMVVSIPLSFLGARNLMQGSQVGWSIYYAVRTIFNVLRSIETLILAVIMAVVVGLGPFAGVMAIVIHSIGAMGKLYSESIESIDPGPIEAITATGATRFQVVLYAVLPQVVPAFLSFTMYRWDINVRLSTVIGLVGGGGIGFLLIQYINLLQWNQAGAALWLIGITVIVMDQASAIIRAKLV